MSTAFDITAFTPSDETFLHLKTPTDEEPIFVTIEGRKEPVGITYHAPGSEPYEAAVAKRTNRSLVRSKKKLDLTADLLRADSVFFLTEITKSFDHLAYPPANGAEGDALFKALYADRKFGWVIEQANTHLGDWSSFTKAAATS